MKCKVCGRTLRLIVDGLCGACRQQSLRKSKQPACPRKQCETPGCKGTLPVADTHRKCSTCRKQQPPVQMSKQEREEIREKISLEQKQFAERLNMSITDPRALVLNRSIGWLVNAG